MCHIMRICHCTKILFLNNTSRGFIILKFKCIQTSTQLHLLKPLFKFKMKFKFKIFIYKAVFRSVRLYKFRFLQNYLKYLRYIQPFQSIALKLGSSDVLQTNLLIKFADYQWLRSMNSSKFTLSTIISNISSFSLPNNVKCRLK